jgi:hypothetical protein
MTASCKSSSSLSATAAKFIGSLGEQPDDLQPFDAKQFAQALFEEYTQFLQRKDAKAQRILTTDELLSKL